MPRSTLVTGTGLANAMRESELGAYGSAAMIWKPARVRMLALGGCACLLWGCASNLEPHSTKPQVSITGTSLDRVKKALVAEMSKHKFRVAKNNGRRSLAQARELPVEDVVRRGKHAGVRSPTEWHRLALEAAHRIAVGLQVDRVAVF